MQLCVLSLFLFSGFCLFDDVVVVAFLMPFDDDHCDTHNSDNGNNGETKLMMLLLFVFFFTFLDVTVVVFLVFCNCFFFSVF